MTSLDGNVFYAFDPIAHTWESLNYPRELDRYASKIHQSLKLDNHGRIYGAIATLSDVDVWPLAPGGQLFRFAPEAREYEFLTIPIKHDYIQGILLDGEREIIYGNTFPGRKLFRYDINSKEIRELTMLGNVQTEHMAMDSHGGVWHNYELFQWAKRYPLLRHDPAEDKIDFLNTDLPDLMPEKSGSNQIDSALLTKDGDLYVGTIAGALVQLKYRPLEIKFLGKPFSAPRLKGLVDGPNGLIYGVCGTDYETRLFTYDRSSGLFDDLGPIQDSKDGMGCWLAHDMCMVGLNTLIVAECDNPSRSSYLFKVELEG
jgi:hypothetical protein